MKQNSERVLASIFILKSVNKIMILIISTCKEKLHELEFVKPIENIIKSNFKTIHYSKISDADLQKADKIIIGGTSLKDNQFIKDIEYFRNNLIFEKPVLGICAGMQIISLIFELNRQVKELDIKNNLNHVIKSKTEIGFYKEKFTKEFLGLKGEQEVYHLHNNYTTLPKNFIKFTNSKIPQAIKHISKPLYGVLFHPEVRNKEIIEKFLRV